MCVVGLLRLNASTNWVGLWCESHHWGHARLYFILDGNVCPRDGDGELGKLLVVRFLRHCYLL